MKAFFILGNLYMYKAPYERIALRLQSGGVKTACYYSGEREWASDEALSSAGVAGIPAFYLNTAPGAFNRIMVFVKLLANRIRLRRFLREERPSAIVVGGDITNMNTRLLLDFCTEMGVPVIIVPLALPGRKITNPAPSKGVPFAGIARRVLGMLNLERTVFFNGWVLGSYHTESVIALPDERSRLMLESNGVEPARLVVTGDPLHDIMVEARALNRDAVRRNLAGPLGISPEGRILCYCTEMIQSVYGDDYAMRIHRAVKEACDSLPEDARVLVKPHPREPESAISELREVFSGGRFRVLERVTDNNELLRGSDLVIAHYSTILDTAALLGSPVLSIRLIDDEAPVALGAIDAATHVTDVSGLGDKIRKALYDREFRERNLAAIDAWEAHLGIALDGRAADRIAMLVRERAGGVLS